MCGGVPLTLCAWRKAVSTDVAVYGARALLLVAFVVLATPPFLYAIAPPLRSAQTALWWCAALILLLSVFLGTRVFATRDAMAKNAKQLVKADPISLMHPLILQASDHAKNLSIHPLFHEHVSERLHQRTNPVLGPIGEMVVQHQPLAKQRMRPRFTVFAFNQRS